VFLPAEPSHQPPDSCFFIISKVPVHSTITVSVGILSRLHPTLPDNSQVCLTHYKRSCWGPSFLLLFSSLSTPSFPFPPPCAHGWPLLLYFLPSLLCLYYPLKSPPYTLNKLYSILYHHVAGPSGGRDASAWARRGTLFPHIIPCLYQTYLWLLF
jgi:hypothetical protein